MQITNKTVVIIGGSSGIGLATAQAAWSEGAQIVITGRSKERLIAAREKLGGRVRTVTLDSADEEGTIALFGQLEQVDHIFVSAATVTFGKGLAGDTASLRPGLDTRFWGSFFAAKYGSAKMPRDGSITLCSGTSALRPLSGASVGSASCGAVEAFGRSLAVELAPIRVNTIVPGLIDTPLLNTVLGERREALMAQAAAQLPVRRVGRPEDIADAILFLMKNGFVTGITLTVDGGRLLV
jgi:NAD(P)-dependent dehydrogenase (short-subunit alcohol dehydrogenase family)